MNHKTVSYINFINILLNVDKSFKVYISHKKPKSRQFEYAYIFTLFMLIYQNMCLLLNRFIKVKVQFKH